MNNPMTKSELHCAIETVRNKAYEFAVKVQPMFVLNDWRWTSAQGMKVPSVDDIFLHVVSLVSVLVPGQDSYGWSSGRISVRIKKHENCEESCEFTVRIELVPFQIVESYCMDQDTDERTNENGR